MSDGNGWPLSLDSDVAMAAQQAAAAATATVPTPAPERARLVLLGTGTVGSAFVARWQRLEQRGLALPRFVALANSRCAVECGDDAGQALRTAKQASGIAAVGTSRTTAGRNSCGSDGSRDWQPPWHVATSVAPANSAHFVREAPVFLHAGDILVDATASDTIAARHADWLARGVHVVTANKLGNGADVLRAQAIARAQRGSGAHYGDAATVGAGLPLLRSIRDLVAGGDRIHALEGVLSGSLAWLFDHFDGMRPFSGFVRAAREAGYTEPDPRIDLSGEDVRRKLLILARAAGLVLEAREVQVDSLLTDALSAAVANEVDDRLSTLDGPLRQRYQAAYRDGAKLRFVGRFDVDPHAACRAGVGLRALPADHPLCGGGSTDNRVAIFSDRYREQPLVIQGPGAGAEITAAALIDDVLRIATR